jgi:hypothetical protein
MQNPIRRVARLAPIALLMAACNKSILDVPNLNNPDVARTYSTPGGVEGVISSTFQQAWAAEVSCGGCINTEGHCMALENYSELANNAAASRCPIPRGPITNDRSGNAGLYPPFRDLSKATRSAANGMQAMDRLLAASVSGNALGSKAQDARARAFGYFALGWGLGGLALAYDSAAIVTPATPSDAVPPLSGYADVTKAALQMLDSAAAIATSANATNGSNGFPLPANWINGNALTQDQFVRLVRTEKARLRAGVARTPAERAAADWSAIIADAQAGITTDFVITLSVTAGWSGVPVFDVYEAYQTARHGMSNMILGMADTSGGYATFIATPLPTRDGQFLIRTPDQRLPQGATRPAQQADTPLPLPGRRYFKNRNTGDDVPISGYGASNYDYRRYSFVRAAEGNGPWTNISKIEMDMLQAEGYIRAGNFAAAATLIDASRAKNSLPSIGTITSAAQAIAGGNACVPRVPQPPSFGTVGCGNILEAMKWEKRMETAYSCAYLCWFTDSRGWGDLVQDTALQWPAPYQEMDARGQPFYAVGGGLPYSAAKGTYGW